jgi:hypothetical protein
MIAATTNPVKMRTTPKIPRDLWMDSQPFLRFINLAVRAAERTRRKPVETRAKWYGHIGDTSDPIPDPIPIVLS